MYEIKTIDDNDTGAYVALRWFGRVEFLSGHLRAQCLTLFQVRTELGQVFADGCWQRQVVAGARRLQCRWWRLSLSYVYVCECVCVMTGWCSCCLPPTLLDRLVLG